MRADKGNCFVVMDRTSYDEKMKSILSDRGTYEVVNKAPFKKVERELNVHLLRLKKEQKLVNNTYRKLRSTYAIPPAIRGSVRHQAGHKRHEKRICCCNFVNNFSVEPNFFRDVEDIILTNFCRLYNERARALQSSITFFLIHPVERA